MSSHNPEKTFTSFTPSQSQSYAQHRLDYHPHLYNTIKSHHSSTSGRFHTILDIGCGPGTAVRSLAPSFEHAIGLDPSEGMIATARSLGGLTSTGEQILFEVSSAEELGANLTPPVGEGTVDLIVAATAAHWFDMPLFWARAGKVLKPAGTVALWTSGNFRVDPSMPGAGEIQAILDKLETTLDGYVLPGNRLVSDLYRDLPLPWTLPDDDQVPELFDPASFVRKEWGTGPGSEPSETFYSSQRPPANLDTLEKVTGTLSPVVRWREAHPELVGTERDVVRVMRREIEAAFRRAGVLEGEKIIRGGVEGVLLMVKKKKA
ncbi:S-adenosyl-L-methionine-dependent methyltransferase [Coniochaeta sp. 2T2.1]|nr:S-adenosyl-L-methionine-dependent methyltransferase [Coniochaeta sp. 2T2.1]